MTPQSSGFFGMGLAPGILEVLNKLGFITPTPIQSKAIPMGMEGKDIIGIAQTGTGKTMAFGIPMVQRLAQRPGKGLILVPTRELAIQVNEALMQITPAFKLKTAVLIGGESIRGQLHRLREQPRIIIATPGRLNDHLTQRQVRVDDVHVLVLDEADRMLDMGFLPQIERILRQVPKDRQTMLFSATMPSTIVKIASQYMRLPVRTEIAPSGTATELTTQELFIVKRESKGRLLGQLLKEYTGSVLLFVRTRRAARRVAEMLRMMHLPVAEIHADRSLAQRKDAMRGFKTGEYRILVATDIAARGIDVFGIELVINYDLPDDPENYVHRIGRTGRAGQEGRAITLATPDQVMEVRKIENIMRRAIPLSAHPDFPPEKFYCGATTKPGTPPPTRRRSFGSLRRRRR